MREFFINGLHIFIIVVIAAFVIFGTMALMGKFDHWDSRFIKKGQHIFRRVRRHLTRNRKRERLHQDDNYDGNRHVHHAHHETNTTNSRKIQ
jgi:hypothetical protein